MIDTKLLRQKILDLAIRGKLVPQDPADEPASELLKKIKAEKEALVKAGKIKKDKHESFIFKSDDSRYYETIDGKTSDVTDEIPFDLPESWVWCRLKNIIDLLSGRDLTPQNYNDKGGRYPYITGASNFDESKLIINRWTDAPEVISIPNDVLLTCKGTIGEITINSVGEIHIARQIMALRPSPSIIKEYLATVLQSMINHIKSEANGLIPGISRDVILELLIPLPPLAEQHRIVEQIETLLGYVDIIDTDAETLEKSITLAKQKILDLAIRGKLVPQDPTEEPASELLKKIKAEKEALVKAGKLKKDKHESFIFKGDDNCYYWKFGNEQRIIDNIPFEIPDNWQWCCLAQVMYLIQTKDKQIKSGQVLKSGKYPVISQGQEDIDGFCNEDDKSIVDLPIILFGDHTRKVKYIKEPFVVGADGTKIFKPLCNAQWLFYWSLYSAENIANRGYGRHWQLFNSQTIPLPPLAEQERIVACITQYESILKSIQE